MHLPRPVYYSCLLTVLVAGNTPLARAATPPNAASSASAARESHEPRAFAIPAGDASTSLDAFSRQSGAALVFVVEQVRGIRTPELQGRYRPREALERLVAKTALTVAEDARTGALMIKRTPPLPSPPAQKPTSQSNQPVKPKSKLALFAGLLALGSAAEAQTPATSQKEDAITLSPFTVRTDRDTGFVAASSLAGGRLASDLKDTPVAYSVLTREFIDALGLDDLDKAVEWTVGAHRNIDAGAQPIFAGTSSYSVRGVSGIARLRNFFPFGVTFDSYNLDRFDFARGPNSVLFGAGSIGGAANTVTKQAVFGKTIRQIDVRTGSWSNNRVATDFNASAENLAVRVNTLWQDSDDWRDDDYLQKRSAFLTTTYRFRPKTQIRLEGEYGELEQRRAFANINDRITGWDGATTFGSIPNTAIPTATRNAAGVTQYGTDNWVFNPASGTTDIINYQNTPTTVGPNAAGTFIGGQPIVGTSVQAAGQSILYQQNLPANRFDRAIAGSSFRLPDREFTPRFSNRPTYKQRYRDFTLYLNHQIGQSFFFEGAVDYNKEERFGDTTYNRGLSDVLIDINRTLPNGATNPNYLKPYFEAAQRYDNVRGSENLSGRIAAAYVADTRIGKFTFNFLGGAFEGESNLRAWALTLPFESDSRIWPGKHTIRYRQYWDQADRSMREFTGPVQTVDPITNTTRSLSPLLVLDTTRADNIAQNKNSYQYGNLAVQAKLLGGRLNLIGAYRRDGYNNTGKRTRFAGDYESGWNAFDVRWRPAAPKDYYTLPAVIARDANGNPTGGTAAADVRPRDANGFRLPQYAGNRFRDDFNPPDIKGSVGTYTVGGVYNLTRWIGLSANYAETFNPASGSVGYDGSLLKPTTSKGIDLGVRLNLLGGKLSSSLNYYRSTEVNAVTGTPAGSQGNFNTIFQANAIGDLSANGRNIRGFADLPLVLRDTIRRKASGFELDTTANLTRQWRLLANVSIAKPLQDNAVPLSIAYYKQTEQSFIQILNDAGVIVNPTTKVATVDNTVPSTIASPNANAAATAWNDIQTTFLRNLVTGPRIITGSNRITGNLFTDYTFRKGWLKDVRLGIGANYRDQQAVGYRGADTIQDPNNPALAIDDPTVDAYTPVYADAFINGTATLAYTWKLKQGRRVAFNLRVDNLFSDREVRYFVNGGSGTGGTLQRPRNGDVSSPARVATPSLFSYPTPLNWTLSARIDF